jgi:hypothetical protein
MNRDCQWPENRTLSGRFYWRKRSVRMRTKIWVVLALMLLVQTACRALPPQVEHELTYTAKGTRSEARHGHLKIDGQEVPWAFSQIVVGDAAYRLRSRTEMWGDDGYHPDPSVPRPSESPLEMSEEAAAQGYYCGSKRLRGTPENWLYVKWCGQSAFVAADRIGRLIEDYRIPIQAADVPLRVRLRRE